VGILQGVCVKQVAAPRRSLLLILLQHVAFDLRVVQEEKNSKMNALQGEFRADRTRVRPPTAGTTNALLMLI